MLKKIFTGLLILTSVMFSQNSPHGGSLRFDCSECHQPSSWKIGNGSVKFNHSLTGFELTGGHRTAECRECHKDLVFSRTTKECRDCHNEPHQNTLGKDCSKCHSPQSWKPIDMIQKHNQFRFSLVGVHNLQDCKACHAQADNFLYSGASVDCYSCHRKEYLNTTNPAHSLMGISTTCDECHTLMSTSWRAEKFVHVQISLKGPHGSLKCNQCHTSAHITQRCYDCHQKDYMAANDPNHLKAGFSQNCFECHNSDNWLNAKFDHSATRFPLTGAHISVSCTQCHTNGYQGTSADCFSCHQANFNKAEGHVAQNFPHECLLCHSTSTWDGAKFDHSVTAFPLTGAHTTAQCSQCHTNGYKGTSAQCSSCHQDKYNAAANPNHSTAGISTDCKQCHNSTAWKPSTFSHSTTRFALTGAHINQQCSSCHKGSTTGAKSDCYSCHQADYTKAANHVSQGYPQTCEQCHSTTVWTGATFNHSATAFPLTGAHTTAQCSQCHTNGYKGTSAQCSSCHQDKYNAAANPNHSTAGISTDCKQCHNSTAWKPSTFSHSTTRFALTGAHINQQCSSCHKGSTTGAKSDCYSCHQADYTKAANHVSQGYPQTCEQCHSTTTWTGATFNHSATAFPLTGSHTTVTCNQCHSSGFKGTPTDCNSCHKTDFTNAVNPSHTSLGISTDCKQCHNSTAWKPSTFSHAATAFPLTGAHITQQCSACHKGTTAGTPKDCYSCHLADYNKAENHVASNYPHTCEQCHSTSKWDGATFNHSATAFPLTGAHTTVTCNQCHSSGYKGTSTLCSSCHQTNFNNAVNPNHVSAGISTDCVKCHSTTAWIPSTFSHATTGFTLTGAHINQQCSSCHKGSTTGAKSDCYSCHQADYTKAANHVSQGYPQTCEQCHSTTTWTGATFNHSATAFPLTGSHTTVTCNQCHSSGFKGTSTVCSVCHQTNYKNTTNPNHTALSIATTCEQCHTTNPAWKPAQFPTHNSYWVIDGAHLNVKDCAQCHQGNYNSTPNTCYGCHKADYDKTTNPAHLSQGFSQDCQACHTKTAWSPASYKNHDAQYFPIYSGKHNGRWNQCTTCHTNSADYKVYTCLTGSCHPKASTDNQHRGRSGYSYISSECYRCHPRGSSNALFKAPSIN